MDRYNGAMHRTTLMLPNDVHQRLRRLAAERGVSMATVVREAIDDKLARSRPKPRSFGIGASGHRDTARASADLELEPRSWR